MKKLLCILFSVVTASIFVFVGTASTDVKADDQTDIYAGTSDVSKCPPDKCYSQKTVTYVEDEVESEEETRGTCTCGLFWDGDCYYRYIPAFRCLPTWHETGDYNTMEWYTFLSDAAKWGLAKWDTNSSQVSFTCPIPTDSANGSHMYYGDVARVEAKFYNHATTTGNDRAHIHVYSSNTGGTYLTDHGDYWDGYSGQRTLVVTPSGTAYAYWWADIIVQEENTSYSSFHSLLVCYDPD